MAVHKFQKEKIRDSKFTHEDKANVFTVPKKKISRQEFLKSLEKISRLRIK